MKKAMIAKTVLLQMALVLGVFGGSIYNGIDKTDSLAVRSILNDVGWKNVSVDSVVDMVGGAFGSPSRVTILNLTCRSGRPQISQLPATIKNLPELLSLVLTGNALSTLPAELGSLFKLTQLNIASNSFDTLPDLISRLPSLQYIYAGDNRIVSLPSSIDKLVNLTILSCDRNRIAKLPTQIQSLTGLTRLSLIANLLDSLPSGIAKLANLEMLRLDSNRLTTLPSQITALQRVKVDIAGNRLCTLTDQSLVTWLTNHHLTPEWRASQQCNDSFSASATDAKTGTVVSFSSPFTPSPIVAHPVSVEPFSSGAVGPLLPGKTILKMVKISVDPVFSGKVKTFLLTFPFSDSAFPQFDPSQLSIYFYDGHQVTYLGGSVDSTKKTVAAQTGSEGVYALVYKNKISAVDAARPLAAPLTLSLSGSSLRVTLGHRAISKIAVSFLTLNGKTVSRMNIPVSGSNALTIGLPRILAGKPCIVAIDDGNQIIARVLSSL